jgi:tetratricopeptide (TPR) repeat protein
MDTPDTTVPDTMMWDTSFSDYVDSISCWRRVFWMQQCYSGGFKDNLENDKTIFLSASDRDEKAWGTDDIAADCSTDVEENEIRNKIICHHGEFNYHVMNSVRGATPTDSVINADADGDGFISMEEVKTWEFEHDSRYICGPPNGYCSPQYSDLGNIGAKTFLDTAPIISGHLTSNTTWEAGTKIYIRGDVTVNNGVTLTIKPGVTVKFSKNFDAEASGEDTTKSELIINGTLIAEGTPDSLIVFTSNDDSPAKGDWYGLVLSDSSSTLDHCTISYADKGLHCYKCSLEINNFDISECNYGAYVETTGTKLYLDSTSISDCSKGIHVQKGALRLTECQLNNNSIGLECHSFRAFYKVVPPFYTRPYPDFKNCEFNNNTRDGILLYDSSPRINYCDISDNDFWGMRCDYASDPTLGYVTLTGNGCPNKEEGPQPTYLTHGGLYTTGTSCPVVCDGIVSGSYDRGYNTITGNCSTGVSAHSYSAPKLGKGLINKGENSIFDNVIWEIYNTTGTTIYAEYNWWDDVTGPNWDKVYGSVDPYPWLVEPPSKSEQRGTTHLATRSSVEGQSTPGEYNELGTIHLLQLEYDQAIEAFEYVLANYPDAPEANYALVHLMHCYRNGGYAADIDPYLNGVALNSQNEELKDLASYMTISQLYRAGQYESALSTIAALQVAVCDEKMQRSVKFRKGMIYRYDLNNKPAAIEAFQDFIAQYPDDHRTPLAQLELDILGVDQSRWIGSQEKMAIVDASLPGDYALYPNYPNPFNAQTSIEYQIREAVKVTLSVYNVLGQRVIVLENGVQPAGQYRAIWEGRDRGGLEVASGIYFARLQAGEFTFTKKMVLLR